MVEQQFIQLLQNYLDALSDRRRFAALLKDLIPGQPMQTVLLLNLFDIEIHKEIEKTEQLSDIFAYRFIKRLCDEYGISKENAEWAVSMWCVCYGEIILGKNSEIAISSTTHIIPPAVKDYTGNLIGNVMNGGFVAVQDMWIYYSNEEDDGKLYKITINGYGKEKLSKYRVSHINIIEKRIYYLRGDDSPVQAYSNKITGYAKKRIIADDCESIYAIGEWIYYINKDDGWKLYRVLTDGRDRVKISDDSMENGFSIVDEWIYYTNVDDSNKFYRVNLDGNYRHKFIDESANSFNVIDEWVYYSNTEDDEKLYRIKIDGSEKQKLSDEIATSIIVADDWVFYCTKIEGFHRNNYGPIYKIRTDGSGKKKLNFDESKSLIVIGDWVYYINKSDSGKIYKLRKDGSEKQLLDGGVGFVSFDEQQYYDSIQKAETQNEKRGNTIGNVINYGMFTIQDEWVYYISHNREFLYKIHIDGSGKQLLDHDGSVFINVLDGWIYYCNKEDDGKPYKIRTDGKCKQKLYNEQAFYINVIGEWIYAINRYKIFRIKTDGSESQTILNSIFEYERSMAVIGEWIYYTCDYRLFKIKIDGSNNVRLTDEEIWMFCVSENWIYYIARNDNQIYKMLTYGNDKQAIGDEKHLKARNFININDGWIYFNEFEKGSLCKMRIDGTDFRKFNNDHSYGISVSGDFVHFISFPKDGQSRSNIIKKDGTECYPFIDWIARGQKQLENQTDQSERDYSYEIVNEKVVINKYYGSDNDTIMDELVIPESIEGLPVVEIGKATFNRCRIKKIYLPTYAEKINDSAFICCKGLEELHLNNNLMRIGKNAFEYCGIESITIPKNVKAISNGLFYGCGKLNRIKLQKGLKTIKNDAFVGCINLKYIDIPDGTVEMGVDIFRECEKIHSIRIPDSVVKFYGDEYRTIFGFPYINKIRNQVTIYCNVDSNAYKYAHKHQIRVDKYENYIEDEE